MNLHEYQAKEILQKYNIPIPSFAVVSKIEEVCAAIERLKSEQAVVKIQVHAGGRGKVGGVRFAKTKEQIHEAVKDLLGMKMVNEQTGPLGVIATKVLLSKPVSIAKEFYLGAVVDRDRALPVLIASFEGGMEIEEIAEKFPDKILKIPFGLDGKVRSYQLLRLAKFMGWDPKKGGEIAKSVARAFMDLDASLLEINPLVLTKENELLALDAKLSIDDSALFRHPELLSLYDPSQESKEEAASKKCDLSYIAMDGDIGCMVNGAGLAMATMDIIKLEGGSPANFLDVGGSASKEKIAEGFGIILSDPKVKAVLVNIFGGIMNCKTIAEGVIEASKHQKIKVPIVIRMEGTNVEEGKKILKESGLKIQMAESLEEAAKQIVIVV